MPGTPIHVAATISTALAASTIAHVTVRRSVSSLIWSHSRMRSPNERRGGFCTRRFAPPRRGGDPRLIVRLTAPHPPVRRRRYAGRGRRRRYRDAAPARERGQSEERRVGKGVISTCKYG